MKINKRVLLVLFAGKSLLSFSYDDNNKYNIVFIMSDDHTSQMISCYDKRYIKTPNIDRIANEGVKFTNSFVANSISGPSRACMLTGKHSCGNRFFTNSRSVFDGSQITFPKLLQQNGYETALIGKWHLKSNPTGFNYWEILPDQGDYYNPVFINENGKYREKGYITNIITQKSINWLKEKRDKNKPFCLLVHHKAVHRNWMPDTCDLSLYEDKKFPLPKTFYDTYDGREAARLQKMNISKDMEMEYDLKIDNNRNSLYSKAYRNSLKWMDDEQKEKWFAFYDKINSDFKKANLKGKDLDEWKFQRYIRDYMKTVESLDRNIGVLLEYLEENNLLDNTLIVYTSDQGFYIGEHGWFDKRFMYEESMRTPLVMRLPKGLKKRGEIKELVQNIDYAPTFLELANCKIPKEIHGKSLLPLLKKQKVKWRNSLYYHYYDFPGGHSVRKHYGVRTDRYKLIHFYGNIDKWEFFDLKSDPNELNNVIGELKYKKVIENLKCEIVKLQKQYNDEEGLLLN